MHSFHLANKVVASTTRTNQQARNAGGPKADPDPTRTQGKPYNPKPLLSIRGFPNNRVIYFIPRLPTLSKGITSSNTSISSASNILSSKTTSIKSKIKDFNLEYKTLRDANILGASSNTFIDKEATFFNRTTYYYKYLEDKDTNILKGLIYLDLGYPNFYTLLFKSTIELGYEISSKLDNLSLTTRSILNNTKSNTNKQVNRFKELYPSTKRSYFREFSFLIVYIYNLAINYKDLYTNPYLNTSLFDLSKDLKALEDYYNSSTIDIEEEIKPKIKVLILKVFNNLLSSKLEISTNTNTTFRNPTIVFFIIRALELDSSSFKKETILEGILSKLIYNSRLFTLGYINNYIKENALDNSSTFLEDYINSNLITTSNNYFSELYLLRNKLKVL